MVIVLSHLKNIAILYYFRQPEFKPVSLRDLNEVQIVAIQ